MAAKMQMSSNVSRLLLVAVLIALWAFAQLYSNSIYDYISRVPSLPDTLPHLRSPSLAGRVNLKEKAAVIIDTQYTPRLLPLILHFQTVLGRSWPIIFYTSQAMFDAHLAPTAQNTSAIWQRAVSEGGVEVRIIHEKFDLAQREGVNIFLSDRWLWSELAPADKVLIFQADAMICANSRFTMDRFLEWDFIGSMFNRGRKEYNGGLSLRNRTMIMEILDSGRSWAEETKAGTWNPASGEDVWFSRLMDERGGRMPPAEDALDFSIEFEWQMKFQPEPLGYHKVHKNAAGRIADIRQWCPEIDLAAAGNLK